MDEEEFTLRRNVRKTVTLVSPENNPSDVQAALAQASQTAKQAAAVTANVFRQVCCCCWLWWVSADCMTCQQQAGTPCLVATKALGMIQ
jgi:hypothetical protein